VKLLDMGISSFLYEHSVKRPEKVAFVFPNQGKRITYGAFHSDVLHKAQQIKQQFDSNNRLLLLYTDVYEFISAFVAAQLAGCVPVPMFPPRNNRKGDRLANIIKDCQPAGVLTSENQKAKLQAYGIQLEILQENNLSPASNYRKTAQSEIGFIQYTSGSTGMPKGVVISNENLIHNLDMMREQYKIDEESVLYSWLPFYHDMGLVGKLLQTIRSGCTLVSVLPNDFIKNPSTWLQSISDYRITHTAAPNFAYDYCVSRINKAELIDVNLGSLIALVNGAEKIHLNTINSFSVKFESLGFNKSVFMPSYGMAETTLFIAGGKSDDVNSLLNKETVSFYTESNAEEIVSSGTLRGQLEVQILDVKTELLLDDNSEGEIIVAGKSVMKKYWNKADNEGFIHLDIVKESGAIKYLRTGDLGVIQNGELFITGRLKELLIIRGKNYLPYDIEAMLLQNNSELIKNGVAVTAISNGNEEAVLVIAEVGRDLFGQDNIGDIIPKIIENVRQYFELEVYDVVLLPQMYLPRTSSGKIQRNLAGKRYLNKDFSKSHSYLENQTKEENIEVLDSEEALNNLSGYLRNLLQRKFDVRPESIADFSQVNLIELGLDSIKLIDLIGQIKSDLGIVLEVDELMKDQSIQDIIYFIEIDHITNSKNAPEIDEEELVI
jgi:acyl-CoA synthetase (AMP-forming)/AMP-acid ligase II/acyl carrier protein